MCDIQNKVSSGRVGTITVPVTEAIGMVLAHDITEVRTGEFKGRAFRKGHVIREEDIGHLQKLGKERLFVLNIAMDEMHEDDAAFALANALMGEGVEAEGEPKEGKINIIACRNGLLKVNKQSLAQFNMLGDVMCATLHEHTVVKRGQVVAGTRAIPLVVKRNTVEHAAAIAGSCGKIIEVREMRGPKTGVVITGNEVYYGRIKDAFAPVIKRKIEELDGEIIGTYYAPDNEEFIEARLRELVEAGADLLITTGGMSVDPDDVTRFAIKRLGASDITYGSPVLPGSMFLIAYLNSSNGLKDKKDTEDLSLVTRHSSLPSDSSPIPIIGIPACGMYHKTTVFDLILPRVLAGENIGRRELAELGHGGLCLNCKECRYPVCPFGK
ncbi:MAG: molybdopterin-binding protein [Nitrospirae bacterium]|nr:molybdopterin-binding protein [Nitrospirota bacterium]